jgi:LysM repeat protein
VKNLETKQALKKNIFILFVFIYSFAHAEDGRISRQEYIDIWRDEAVFQMHQYGIPASITMAQGILESGDGNSYLAQHANNHFGIKCHEWTGAKVYKDDDSKNECFRKYPSASDSYTDHSKFLAERSRYESLFTLKTNDYKGWAKGLKKAGYATNPAYAELLIDLIEKHKLYELDQEVVAQKKKVAKDVKKEEAVVASTASSKHQVKVSANNIKYIVAQKGDTYAGIALAHQMGLWQIYKYNDITEDDILKIGDVIYLQPKRNKAKDQQHIAKHGETLKDISQQHGVKLKKLQKRNAIKGNPTLTQGQKIVLR